MCGVFLIWTYIIQILGTGDIKIITLLKTQTLQIQYIIHTLKNKFLYYFLPFGMSVMKKVQCSNDMKQDLMKNLLKRTINVHNHTMYHSQEWSQKNEKRPVLFISSVLGD